MTNYIQYSVAPNKYSGSKKGQGNSKEGLHHTKPEMQGDKHSVLCLHVLQLGWRCQDMSNNGLGQPHPFIRAICSPHVLVLECLHSIVWSVAFLGSPSKVLAPPLQCRLHLHSFTHCLLKSCLQGLQSHYTLPGLPGLLLKCG